MDCMSDGLMYVCVCMYDIQATESHFCGVGKCRYNIAPSLHLCLPHLPSSHLETIVQFIHPSTIFMHTSYLLDR